MHMFTTLKKKNEEKELEKVKHQQYWKSLLDSNGWDSDWVTGECNTSPWELISQGCDRFSLNTRFEVGKEDN